MTESQQLAIDERAKNNFLSSVGLDVTGDSDCKGLRLSDAEILADSLSHKVFLTRKLPGRYYNH